MTSARRSVKLEVRLSPSEKRAVERLASAAGLRPSEFVRRAMLGETPAVEVASADDTQAGSPAGASDRSRTRVKGSAAAPASARGASRPSAPPGLPDPVEAAAVAVGRLRDGRTRFCPVPSCDEVTMSPSPRAMCKVHARPFLAVGKAKPTW